MENIKKVSNVLNTEPANAMGWTTVFSTIFMWFLEKIEHLSINDTLQFFVTLGGLIFIVFKIWSQALDVKIKKRDLKDNGEH